MKSKKCKECGKEFKKKSNVSNYNWEHRTLFCSRECYNKARRKEIICAYCGKIKVVQKHKKTIFCSQICANRWKAKNGKSGFFKGHPGYVKDYSFRKPMTQEVKDKISRANTNNPKLLKHLRELNEKYRGSNHWSWKGGITKWNRAERQTKKYDLWRKAVYARDHYNCRKCGVKCKSETIIAHHKKPWKTYVELRYKVSNGITVCRKCHKKIHKEIGLKTRFMKS